MIDLNSSLYLITFLTSFLAYIIVVTISNIVSAWFVKQMGDPTAQEEGFFSLNPLHHIDITGALCLLLLGLGWGKRIPIDHRNIPNRVKLVLAYISGSFVYICISIIALAFLLKGFGFKVLFVAKTASVKYLNLSQLSAAYPTYSSFSLSCALIGVEIIFFSILLAAVEALLQGFRLVLLIFFPERLSAKESDIIVLFMPLLLMILFIEPLFNIIWKVVFFLGVLLGYVFGAQ